MQLAFPLELNRTNFDEHLVFLKECGAEQVPLYFMVYEEDAHPMAPGTELDRMQSMLRENLAAIRTVGLSSDVLYVDFRVKPGDTCGADKDAQAWFRELCRVAAEQGIKHIGFFPNNPGRESTDAEWDKMQCAGYRFMAETASDNGLDICAHINMVTGSRYDRREDIDNLFARVGADNFGLLFCFGCIALAGLDVPDMIRHWKDRIFVVHLRDVADSWQEGNSERQFGQGKIDLPASIAALREIGYKGILHPEHFPILKSELPIEKRPLFDHAWDRGPMTTAWTLGFWRGMLEERKIG